jgi:hypothetical protein
MVLPASSSPPLQKSKGGPAPTETQRQSKHVPKASALWPSITLSALSRDTWSVRVSDALDLALNLGVWFLLIRKPLLLLLLLLLLLPLLMATQARFAESGDGS